MAKLVVKQSAKAHGPLVSLLWAGLYTEAVKHWSVIFGHPISGVICVSGIVLFWGGLDVLHSGSTVCYVCHICFSLQIFQ